MITDAQVEAQVLVLHEHIEGCLTLEWCRRVKSARCKCASIARRALEAGEAAAWQPIETKPQSYSVTEPHVLLTDGLQVGTDCDYIENPTHWRPLPEVPRND